MIHVPGKLLSRIRMGFIVLAACLLILMSGSNAMPNTCPTPCIPPCPAKPGTCIINHAVATCADANGNPLPEVSAEVETIVSGCPVLKICKVDSPDPVARGEELTYTIHYENKGSAPATGVTITDFLPRHLIFLSASEGGVYTPKPLERDTITWNPGTIQGGEKGTLTLTTKVKTLTDYFPLCPTELINFGLIYNIAMIHASLCADGASPSIGLCDKAITLTRIKCPHLKITRSATPETVKPGEVVTYTVYYQNIGDDTAHDVQIREELAAGLTYVEGSMSEGGSAEGKTLTWNLEPIPAGAEGTVSFKAIVSPSARQGNTIHSFNTILC